ncbi:hypothetical protein CY652_03090 [Burkholderia sp. WAC0059]|uniref:DUF2795 domain-containing protein n=1 Tax=Burkholderia sp. WAC0059 TaxID=2066022 RepID=UPI000C7EE514|nr:DUF2795 domain-containing protein [Burkholderia sp. WAC0059]PLZ03970.1 hypothetical protein CY652_03090 [Burkholderia sp. WAC0059]
MPASSTPDEPIDLQLADLFGAVTWPANRDALIDAARAVGASNEILTMLDGLPEQDYADVRAVTHWIGSGYGPGLGV